MRLTRSRLALTLLALFGASAPSGATPADEAAIRAHGREWVRAFKAGDIEALMALYTPDAEVALHGQRKLKGLAAIRAYFTPILETPPAADFHLAEESLVVAGKQAFFLSKYWFTLHAAKGDIRDAGRSLIVYQQGDDGIWRLRIDIDQAAPDVTYPVPVEAK